MRGHRRILETLREFHPDPERPIRCDRGAARALVAFLRQEILPFARREEHLLAADSAEHEATTFEHAFLAAEIEALARTIERWHDAAGDPAHCAGDVQRSIHRIEAVLELHTARDAERWLDASADSDVRASVEQPGSRGEGARGALSLTDSEIDEVLRRHWWGVLSTVADGRPYAVPVAYGMHGPSLYIASREGRKVRNLDANPTACLTVAEVRSGAEWKSVVVMGNVEWVTGPLETVTALRALQRQCNRPLATSAADATRLIGARMLRIVPTEVTGRTRRAL